jgi:hypothetical protein
MLQLTDEQMEEVKAIAAPLTPFMRQAFLRSLCNHLGIPGTPIAHGDADVYRAALAARRDVLESQRRRA